jgi:PAS domain S-box-containing protein
LEEVHAAGLHSATKRQAFMTLALRLSVAMILLVVLTTAGTALVIYKRAADAARPVVFESLKVRAGIIADDLADYVDAAREDVLVMSRMPSVRASALLAAGRGEIIRDHTLDDWRNEVAAEMAALVGIKTNYAQFRLIAASGDGRELVRIQRGLDGVEIVPEGQLQAKSHRNYVSETMALPVGAVYVSPINYNREGGVLEEPAWPTIRIATPVRSEDGEALGLVIVNLDLQPIFNSLPGEGFPGGSMYLIDENGYYLMSPKPGQAFAFERGTSANFQSDWPDLAPFLTATGPSTSRTLDPDGADVVVAGWPVELAGKRRVTLIEAVPASLIFRGSATMARSSFITGTISAALAGLLAILVAASMTNPLRAITRAIGAASRGEPVNLPVGAPGEPGALARAFNRHLEQESLLNAIIASSVDSIVTVDMEGSITTWNPAAEGMYGYTAKEVLGRNIDILIPVDRRMEMVELMDRIARGESIDVFDTVKLDKSGKPLEVSLTMAPVRDPKGVVVGASRIARDITRKRAADRRLRRLQAEASHASRINASGQMAGAMAHEMNQPLTAIINYARSARRLMLKRGIGDDDEVIRFVDRAAEQGQRASDIIKRIRLFIGNRQDRVEREDINAVIEGGLETALLEAGTTDLNVARDYAPDLPTIPVDRIQIQQVVANLVRNAIQAMEASENRTLKVSTTDIGDFLSIGISDTGPGISDEVRAHLFEAYATTKVQGMGIGLTISRSIVETHGGHLGVNTAVDGTEFSFTLPKEHI